MTSSVGSKGSISDIPCSGAATFLEAFGADHLLCSIDPQAGAIRSRRGDTETVLQWAQAENAAGRNIYYHFNVVRAGLTGKASKNDITQIRGVPDDLDWGWKHHSGSYPERVMELGNQQQRSTRQLNASIS